MKNIVAFAVKFPITIIMMVCAVLLLGFISFDNLGIDLFPNLNSPKLFVEIKAGERPPEEIEKQFIEGIESLAIRQKGVTQVSSVSKAGSGRITVQYSWDKDMDQAFLELQKSLTSYSQNTDIEELTITQHDPNATPVMIIGLYHPNVSDFNELRKTAENYIRNELIRLEGIADVKLAGQLKEEIIINTDPLLLESYGLSVDQLVSQIQSYNRSVSGGAIEELGKKYIIKGTSILSNAEDLEDIVVGYTSRPSDGQNTNIAGQNQGEQNQSNSNKVPVLLREVAQVSIQNKEASNIVRINQKRSLGLSIYKETKFNTVKAVQELEAALKEIEKALPGYQFVIVQNQGNFILQAINEVEESGLLGAFFAIIILFIFLRRVGTTFIISVAIPVSIVATFNLMYFNGLSLNVMTLGGLALGAGMLVDNAIVVMENIFRNLESGTSIKEAAIKGTSEVSGAITASTITTIIVFLPIVYVQGASGELFKDQAWTVAFSLISSLIVAILVIPMLFSRIIKKSSSTSKKKSIEFKSYGNFLHKILKLRKVVILIAILLIGISYYLLKIIGSEYMPKTDARTIAIEIELPEGTKLERTHNTVKQIEHQIYTLFGEHIKNMYSHVGTNENETTTEGGSFKDEHTANIKVVFGKDSPIGSQKAITALGTSLQNVPELKVRFSEDESALQAIIGIEKAPLVVEVKGRDFKEIESILAQIEENMATNSDFFNIKSSMEDRMTQIEVKVDKYMAGLHNITTESITNQVKDQLSGKEAGQLEKGGETHDILIKIPEVTIGQLDNITLKNGARSIRLDEVTDIQTVLAPGTINRRNQNRVATISAQVNDDKPFDKIVKNLEESMSEITLPPNYKIEVIGEELKRKESVKNLTFALLLSIVLVYMVLASQFESLLHPFTILLTIPLAGVGAVLIFFFLGQPLNIMAYIGIIMLTGIAVNDSIILVDAINRNKTSGMQRLDAIVKAGEQRIRPIIMTSLTTILALLPLTFGFGESVALRSPMALAVIGGLFTSTLLTLVVIPCVYMVLDQLFTRSSLQASKVSN